MPTSGLLVIAPVRVGLEEELRVTLNRFGNDILGKRTGDRTPRIDFARSSTIHFARLTLLRDPDRGPARQRLLLATDFDGTWQHHVDEIWQLTREPESIWGCCEGFSASLGFAEFIQRHTVQAAAYYIAFRGERADRIRRAIGIREWFQKWLADRRAAEVFRAYPDLRDLVGGLRRIARAIGRPVTFGRDLLMTGIEVADLMSRLGTGEVFEAAKRINATLNRVGWIRLFNLLVGNKPAAPPHRFSEAKQVTPANPTPAGYPPENAVLQNQLTLVTDVQAEALPCLRAVLALVDLYGRRLSPPGSLVGISTIHTVRWTLIDDGRRLLMVSNYDGTWENYIDEFAEMILSGLDALWASSTEYPRAGAQDVAALKQFLRQHQVPANAFYSAYPEASVQNLKEDLDFARWSWPIVLWLARSKRTTSACVTWKP